MEFIGNCTVRYIYNCYVYFCVRKRFYALYSQTKRDWVFNQFRYCNRSGENKFQKFAHYLARERNGQIYYNETRRYFTPPTAVLK